MFIALAGESSHQVEPVFIVQFLFGDLLADVQELLCDEAFQFAEGLLLKNRPVFVLLWQVRTCGESTLEPL